MELDGGVELLQAIDLRQDPAETELVTRAEHDIHRWQRALGAHRARALLQAADRARRRGQKGQARGREPDTPRGPHEELRAELVLQLLDALAERGGCERHRARGGAEVQELGCRAETAKRLDRRKLHRSPC